MGKHMQFDDESWWLGDEDMLLPYRPAEGTDRESFSYPSRYSVIPASPPFVDEPPGDEERRLRPAPNRRIVRQRKLVRLVAPLLILGLLAALVVVIRLPDAAAAQPTITQSDEIQAYIVGEVAHPGVYALRSGDRVDALLQAAGGAKADADLTRVNLAAYVTDGEEVFVPAVGQSVPGGLSGGDSGKVNINTSSAEDMAALLPISLTTTKKIVAYREAHGPYTAITQLLNVMSRTTYDKIRDFITV